MFEFFGQIRIHISSSSLFHCWLIGRYKPHIYIIILQSHVSVRYIWMLIYLNGRYAYGNFFNTYNIDYVSAQYVPALYIVYITISTIQIKACVALLKFNMIHQKNSFWFTFFWFAGRVVYFFLVLEIGTKCLILWLFCLYMHVYQCISDIGTPQSSLTPCSTFTSTWKYHNFPEVTRIGASLRQSLAQNYRAVNPLKPWVPSSTRFSWHGRHESGENCLNEVCLS